MNAKPKVKPTPASTPAVFTPPTTIIQEVKTGLRRAWGVLTLKVRIQSERPAGTPWDRWSIPVLESTIYLVVEVKIIKTTLIYGFIELY